MSCDASCIRAGRWVVAVLASGLLSGCGAEGPPTVTVRGTITYQEKPVDHGVASFVPSQGQPQGGPVAADGSYRVELPPGDYRVIVNAPGKYPEGWDDLKDGPPPPDPGAVPAKYARPSSSGLTATITLQEELQVLDFALD